MTMPTETNFFIEHGCKHYGPFKTADDAANYGNQQLGFGVEFAVGSATISKYRCRLVKSERITAQEAARLRTRGIPQPDGSVLQIIEEE